MGSSLINYNYLITQKKNQFKACRIIKKKPIKIKNDLCLHVKVTKMSTYAPRMILRLH